MPSWLRRLLYPEVIHAGQEIRIFHLEGLPQPEIARGRLNWVTGVEATQLLRLQREAEEVQIVVIEERLDIRKVERVRLDMEEQIAAAADAEEIAGLPEQPQLVGQLRSHQFLA